MKTYTFTEEQLSSLLYSTIEMFIEYRDVHDHSEENARFAAVGEMFEGLEADVELFKEGVTAKTTLQVSPENKVAQ